MGMKDVLTSDVKKIFKEQWSVRDGQKVPAPEDLVLLGNDARHFERATILYADISGSTDLVNQKDWQFAAEIYKTFLHCAGQLVKAAGGIITSYDGDRIMAVFIGDYQTSPAVKCALKINWAAVHIVNTELRAQYPLADYAMRHVVGIDTSEVRAARIGVRGGNDLVWVGRCANYAAKLTELSHATTIITADCFAKLNDEVKYGGNPRQNMWNERIWSEMNGQKIYSSSWWWDVDS